MTPRGPDDSLKAGDKDQQKRGFDTGKRRAKISHVRFFYGKASQKKISREIFSRGGLPENFLT